MPNSYKITIQGDVSIRQRLGADDYYHQMGYKKCTIAFLKEILDTYGIGNTLKKYLNGTSKYRIPQWENSYGTL